MAIEWAIFLSLIEFSMVLSKFRQFNDIKFFYLTQIVASNTLSQVELRMRRYR